ncbi:MAG: flavin reductase family protein [Flavobacteriales bacterium]|nr:flavin reductase family protein [Flavobacteriales bacterium]
MLTLDPKSIPTPKLHGYLLSAIAPRPIAFASTIDAEGRPNLAPFSFFNVFSANPPILIFSPARRNRDNTTKHTFENALSVPEVVINIVDYNLVQQCSLASTDYPEGVSEFEKAGLTPLASEIVKPFRVSESPVQFECKINDVIELGKEGGAGNLVIAEVVRMHIQDRVLNDEGKIDPLKMNQVGRCGGNWYSSVNSDSMFEVEKPIRNLGIGIDQIPADIRNSNILTGNDLGLLGNVESLPNETDVNEYKLVDLADVFIELEDHPAQLEIRLHEQAKSLLSEGKVDEAWKTLLAFNNG